MITIRKSQERGHTQINWLSSFHTFSFANYYDPNFMGFDHLRVINEDTVQPGYGFDRHPHKNMEIISYVIQGSLAHKDSLGNGSVIKPGEIQIMSAGTGIEHSEYNNSNSELLHFLQIWIIPSHANLQPRYDQKKINKADNQLILIGSPNPLAGAVKIYQDVNLYVAYLKQNASVEHALQPDKKAWLQLIKGKINLNGITLSAGDGAAIIQTNKISVKCFEEAEFLLFE